MQIGREKPRRGVDSEEYPERSPGTTTSVILHKTQNMVYGYKKKKSHLYL